MSRLIRGCLGAREFLRKAEPVDIKLAEQVNDM